jgi:bifunctional DNA-binding transcriptional regulator/antitoxin component of YhaV-PrlF toxin-antitoxin module
MADITKVTERGQTAIPARMRREHKVEPGTELVWEAVACDEWRVHIRRKAPEKPEPMAMRGFARRFRAVRSTADWMRELREGDLNDEPL